MRRGFRKAEQATGNRQRETGNWQLAMPDERGSSLPVARRLLPVACCKMRLSSPEGFPLTPTDEPARPLLTITADPHAGATLQTYRAYLDSKYRDEFDAW